MSAVTFEALLRLSFGERYDDFFSAEEATAYTRFERIARERDPMGAPSPDLSFAFERVRLAIAMALLELLIGLTGGHEAVAPNDEAVTVQRALHVALREARSPADIDAIVGAEAEAFERLYTDLYVNDDGEQVLLLFERTLNADTRRELDHCLVEAAELAQILTEDD